MSILGRLFGTSPQSESNPDYRPRHAQTAETPNKNTVPGILSRKAAQRAAKQ